MASSRRRRPSRHGGGPQLQHTSVPTGRAAYAETRRWLLETHGPVCAYCGRTFTERTLTLDHVTPRRGQSAYDRRDNLVLACKTCNTAKADKSFLAWVLGHKTRARHLFVYGQHLSAGILDILRPMAGNATALPPAPAPRPRARHVFGPGDDDGASPYSDEPSPYLDETAAPKPGAKPGAKPARRRRSRGGNKKR
jgi:5-methylcytosine-specific restriction endonuclease McrA